MTTNSKPTLIYDGQCPMCRRAAAWVGDRAPDAFERITCQSDDRAQRFPHVTEKQCMEAMQLVYPDGTTYAGEQALPHLLREMKGWRWLARLVELPGIRHLSPHVYRTIAKNRQAISTIIKNKQPAEGAACGLDQKCD